MFDALRTELLGIIGWATFTHFAVAYCLPAGFLCYAAYTKLRPR
jgi:hypothetical protein